MIERAIENWLTNTTERSYQLPFCQVLLHKGHRVIDISKHGPMERGKDIVTISPDGTPCAWQLKTGKINTRTWREIKGEVMEMIELPITHPSVDKSVLHRSYLVTNGEITSDVRDKIDLMNEDNRRKHRNYSYLDLVAGQSLLKDFLDAQGRFMPQRPRDFELFLKLVSADGKDFIPKAALFEFFNSCLFGAVPSRPTSARHAISSSVIVCAYTTHPYQIERNYFALFECWTSLSACIIRFAHRTGLDQKCYADSLSLTVSEALRNLCLLRDEALAKGDFFEGSPIGDGGLVYQARATLVLGALAALELIVGSTHIAASRTCEVLDLLRRSIRQLSFWGEWSFPFLFSVVKLLEAVGDGDTARFLACQMLQAIVKFNSPGRPAGLPCPYYGPQELLLYALAPIAGTRPQSIDFSQFPGSSYSLGAIVHMLARRDMRRPIEELWRRISRIDVNEFEPERVEDTFLWRADKGANRVEPWPLTQSWASLIVETNSLTSVPCLLKNHVDFLRLLILVCPHRATRRVVALLDGDG